MKGALTLQMNYLQKQYSVIMAILAFTTTLTTINLMKTHQVLEAVQRIEPVVVESIVVERVVEAVQEVEPVPEVEDEPIRINCPLDDATQQMILDKSEEHGVDFTMTMGVIYTESRFQPDVISSGGDYGLMQINQINHEWLSEELGITDFLDPEQNVTAGLHILSTLSDKYDDPAQVLMAYNMGERGAKKLWDQGIYTSDYAEKVLQQQEIYNAEVMNDVH